MKKNYLSQKIIIEFFLYLILLIPNFFVVFYALDLSDSWVKKILYFLVSFFLWFFLASLHRGVFLCFGFLMILLAPVEISIVKLTTMPISLGFIEAIFLTNFQEAKEQIFTQFPLVLIYIFLAILYIFLAQKNRNFRYDKKTKISGILGLFMLNFGIFVQMYRLNHYGEKSLSLVLSNAISGVQYKYRKIYPVNFFVHTFYYLKQNFQDKKLQEKLSHFSFGARKKKDSTDTARVVVLVLGESARYGNFSVNGYTRNTTPNLLKIKDLISYSDMYSQANMTSVSVPQIVTRATPERFDLQFQEKTILSAFSQAGFETIFISNQPLGMPISKRMAEESQSYYPINQSNISLDEKILPMLDKVLKLNQSKKDKLIVIHTMGSHFSYDLRHSKNFEKFTPVFSMTGTFSKEMKNSLTNSYDNTILYTDYILSQIIFKLDSLGVQSSMIYVSDHGENLYDDGKSVLHGTEDLTIYEAHIPFFVWLSEQSKEKNPILYENLQKNKNQKATTESVFYTLLDMGNIEVLPKFYQKEKSLGNSFYQSPKKRSALNVNKEIIYKD